MACLSSALASHTNNTDTTETPAFLFCLLFSFIYPGGCCWSIEGGYLGGRFLPFPGPRVR